MTFYEDLDLRLQSDGDRFNVHARLGDMAATERLELDNALFRELLHIEGADPELVRSRGADLFDALIHGRIHNFYHQVRGRSSTSDERGFRLRLIFNPRDERVRRLIDLPWEILRDRSADANDTPALDAFRPIVRTIETTEPPLPVTAESLREVLIALANPGGTDALDVSRERKAVETELARTHIDPRVIERTTRNALMDTIAETRPQIVHFMGHSDIDRETDEGVLILEDEHGEQDRLGAATFAGFFAGRPAPRLVILTSCLSARRTPRQPFAGIAFSLVATGLPAVIAMQSKIGDESAIRFTERLYSRIGFGDPIEAAVADARRALKSARRATTDWAAPVLFVRSGSTRQIDAHVRTMNVHTYGPVQEQNNTMFLYSGGCQHSEPRRR